MTLEASLPPERALLRSVGPRAKGSVLLPRPFDHDLDEVIEFYATRMDADRELADILADEPGWVEKLEI